MTKLLKLDNASNTIAVPDSTPTSELFVRVYNGGLATPTYVKVGRVQA